MGMKFVQQMLDICDDLVAHAATIVEPHDDGELTEFAARLSGLEGLECDGMHRKLHGVTIPGDFRHLRLHNLTVGRPWGGYFSDDCSPLTIDTLLRRLWVVSRRDDVTEQGRGVLVSVTALPIVDAGTLELGLTYQPLN